MNHRQSSKSEGTPRTWLAPAIVATLIVALIAVTALGAAAVGEVSAAGSGRIYDAYLSERNAGDAATTFSNGTRTVYLNFSYAEMYGHVITATVYDTSGNSLFATSRTLTGQGTTAIALDSQVVVQRYFEALDEDTTALIVAVDDALANLFDPVARAQHTQNALAITNRMRGAVASLGALPMPPAGRAALYTVADKLAEARSEGLAAIAEDEAANALPHLQAMRAHAIQLIVALRDARERSVTGGRPFPPTVDCQPYVVNVVVNGLLRQSLEFAIGDPGAVADLQLRPGRHVLFPGLRGMDATALFATLVDPACAPVRDGTVVTYTVAPAEVAVVSPPETTTKGGSTQSYVRAFGGSGGTVLVAAHAGGARSVIVLRLGEPPQSVTLTAAHQSLIAGQSTTLTARVSSANGRAVSDGTAVVFEVTPAGGGTVTPLGAVTQRGMASTVFTAGPTTGRIDIVADVAGVRGGTVIDVQPRPPASATVPPPPTQTPPPGPTAVPPPTAAPDTHRPGCNEPGGGMCDATLIVHVYRDDTCDRRFDTVWDRGLADVPVTIAFGNGHTETVSTSSSGIAWFGGLNIPHAEGLEVYVELPPGTPLCYNSSDRLTLREADFEPSRYERVSFRTH